MLCSTRHNVFDKKNHQQGKNLVVYFIFKKSVRREDKFLQTTLLVSVPVDQHISINVDFIQLYQWYLFFYEYTENRYNI